MKILALGDPHGILPKNIPQDIDLILITGDLGKADLARKRFFENKEREQNGLKELPEDKVFIKNVHNEIHNSTVSLVRKLVKYAPAYSIQGNVGLHSSSQLRQEDQKWNLHLSATRDEIDKYENFHFVKNILRDFGGLRIGFLEYFVDTCWIREFRPLDYREKMKKAQKETDKAKRVLRRFSNLDILVCHQLPYGVLDEVNWRKGKHAGSKVILDYVKTCQPRFVLCGHIHEAKGEAKIGRTKVYNIGCCGDYKVLEL
jgi:Icc-related predicted phosphoesterase